MINVTYHRDLNRLTVEGHAMSGEAGHDLVCASASILCYTLAVFVKRMQEAGQVRYPTIDISEGNSVIACEPPNRYKSSVTLVYDSICTGFDLLARDYPENISFEIRGKI